MTWICCRVSVGIRGGPLVFELLLALLALVGLYWIIKPCGLSHDYKFERTRSSMAWGGGVFYEGSIYKCSRCWKEIEHGHLSDH